MKSKAGQEWEWWGSQLQTAKSFQVEIEIKL